jgi:prolipoprotein diacylglyceryltransferase
MLSAALPSPDSALFEAGPLTIHGWTVCVVVGAALGLMIGALRARSRGLPWDVALSALLWAAPLAVILGRAQAVIQDPGLWFGKDGDPTLLLSLSTGGIGVWGALAGGVLGVAAAARSRGLRVAALADVVALPTLAACAVGVWGQWFSQEGFGSATKAFWGWDVDPSVLAQAGLPVNSAVQPLPVLLSAWAIVGCVVVQLVARRGSAPGGTEALVGLAWLSAGLALVAWLRHDVPAERASASASAVVGMVVVVVALVLALFRWVGARRAERGSSADGAEPVGEFVSEPATTPIEIAAADEDTARTEAGEAATDQIDVATDEATGQANKADGQTDEAHDQTAASDDQSDVADDQIAEAVAASGVEVKADPGAENQAEADAGEAADASALEQAHEAPDAVETSVVGAADPDEPDGSTEETAPESEATPEPEPSETESGQEPTEPEGPTEPEEPEPEEPEPVVERDASDERKAHTPSDTATTGAAETTAASETTDTSDDDESPYPTADDVADGSEDPSIEEPEIDDADDVRRPGRRRKD